MAAKEVLKLAAQPSARGDDLVGHGVSSSESENEDEDNKHENLLKIIETLDNKSKKRKKAQRTEPSLNVSEFHLSSADADKVDVSDLIGSLQQGSNYGGLRKKLASMEKNSAPMDLPLHKPQAEKIQRTVAFEETSKDISKWQPIVKKNREAEHLSFPMKPFKPTEMTTKTLAVTFKPRTPLEEEVAAILKGSSHVIERENKELTEAEEQALLAMDLEQAKERRHELQRMRALQSYYEEKCRRTKKIKSKKYHRIKKKAEKRAASKQSLEELQKTDPEKAREELEKLDQIRAKERVSLKHRNTSKWAKNLMIHGHKDPEAKKALQEQLVLSQQLTMKRQNESESEGEEEEQETGLEDDVTSGTYGGLVTSADNPWSIDKTGSHVREMEEEDTQETGKLQRLQPVVEVEKIDIEDHESSEEEKEQDDFELQVKEPSKLDKSKTTSSIKGKKSKKKDEKNEKEKDKNKTSKEKGKTKKKKDSDFVSEVGGESGGEKSETNSKKKAKNKKRKLKIMENEEEECETDDVILSAKLENSESNGEVENAEVFDIDKDDSESNGTNIAHTEYHAKTSEKSKLPSSQSKIGMRENERHGSKEKVVTIDPKKIFRIEETSDAIGESGSRDHILNIQQAFANDDVIEEFAREKEEAIDSSKPKDVDLTLPGWGEWGGVGLQPSNKKKNKFIVRAAPGPERKDKHLSHVIINEERNRKFAKNQVKKIPHPYASRTQFERTIRNPVGKHWNTASSVKELTKPRVQTLIGTIIDPIGTPKQLKRKTDGKGNKFMKNNDEEGSGLVIYQ